MSANAQGQTRPGGPDKPNRSWELVAVLIAGLLLLLGAFAVSYTLGDIPLHWGHGADLLASRACVTRLKQITLAYLIYAEDHDQKPPAAMFWPEALAPYLSGRDLDPRLSEEEWVLCPEDKRRAKQWMPSGPDARGRIETSYTQNWRTSGQSLGNLREDAVLCYDGLTVAGGPDDLDARHTQGANIGFADGHVKWHRPEDIGPEAWAARKRG